MSQPHNPLGIKQSQPQRDKESGNNPESGHNGDLSPAAQFKVVLERRHPKYAFSGEFERAQLQNLGNSDDYENATQNNGKNLYAGHNIQSCLRSIHSEY